MKRRNENHGINMKLIPISLNLMRDASLNSNSADAPFE